MFRILVVLPLYGGSLPIGRYCVAALRQLGHSVRVFDAPLLYAGYSGISKLDLLPRIRNALENTFLRMVSQAIWQMAEEQQPQIVLALAQAPLDRLVLQKMRQAGMHTIMWFVEDFRLFTYWQTFAPLYDAFAVIQKEPFLKELARIGQKHAFYLPLAALPSFHKPIKLTSNEKKKYGAAISFLGAGYPNRRLAFRPLAGRDFKIWGSDWDEEEILRPNIQRNGERISEEEAVKIYNATDINLNLHSSVQTEQLVSGGDFVNPRTFELAATGAFQLVDRRELLAELFQEDELATFSTVEEMLSNIDYFLEHPEERKEYMEKAQKRVLAAHTYEQRMKKLVDYMAAAFQIIPELPQSSALLEEVTSKLQNIAIKLGLPPNAGPGDIASLLRQHEGILDDQEALLVFLQEWEKQYKKY